MKHLLLGALAFSVFMVGCNMEERKDKQDRIENGTPENDETAKPNKGEE